MPNCHRSKPQALWEPLAVQQTDAGVSLGAQQQARAHCCNKPASQRHRRLRCSRRSRQQRPGSARRSHRGRQPIAFELQVCSGAASVCLRRYNTRDIGATFGGPGSTRIRPLCGGLGRKGRQGTADGEAVGDGGVVDSSRRDTGGIPGAVSRSGNTCAIGSEGRQLADAWNARHVCH